ncbi:Ninja-family protein AFP3 [Hibiscus syriacus]|uniref:Ninja-family protein n=1 Tax=Hibiscus syriacus TaxID=106335 RepID=A0A6A2ZJ38_HIBSY|nr:ninja-family protein AFP3-like [Hibiscus syriacus]KAE8691576.1 Ninja-family protein AFP3 [Hibiscus syriacus]
MAKAEEIGKKETQRNIPMHLGNLPRDLLQRFMSSGYHFSHTTGQEQEAAEEEEIELSLGLSLNGRFGVDPRAKKLKRSSSIPDFIDNSTRREYNEHAVFPMACGSLLRTCSLPTETEEEWRKRKELQSLRRMEAKRKRSEKQKNLRGVRDRRRGGFGGENCEDDKREEGGTIAASIGSQGSGSSGISELESQPPQETQRCPNARSPTSVQLATETEQKPILNPGKTVTQKSEKLAGVGNQPSEAAVGEKKMNIVEDMPCVSTTGDGPNGKKIEGFLYRYRKGEEVKIVCVCHGSFLSPAEFVKHAGGRDAEHPLRRIVVNPSFIF